MLSLPLSCKFEHLKHICIWHSQHVTGSLLFSIKPLHILQYKPAIRKQRWSRGHKAQGQGQGHKKNPRPRPRTAFPRTDTLEAKDRNARGQGPRTQSASALQKKKVFTKIFQAISTKKRVPKNFSSASQNFNIPKNRAVLEPRTGQFSRT